MDRFEHQLRESGPRFAELIHRIPLQTHPVVRPDWLRCEMLERHQVLQHAALARGSTVLEIGAGGQAISTVPLAFGVGDTGRVVAAERARWDRFMETVAAGGLQDRVLPVACDARRLPFRDHSFAQALCVHGLRSLGTEESRVDIIREMLRVAPRIFLAESLPIAENDAQRAHLAMYDLREEVFEATTGRRDDTHYLPLDQLARLVKRAGGVVERSTSIEVDLPHALAYFPRSLVESIAVASDREALLRRWDSANARRERNGEDHPPVGAITARRASNPSATR
ncbi:MAG: class I SAM-dependent methyltransferase [Thermoplasmata archaeon]